MMFIKCDCCFEEIGWEPSRLARYVDMTISYQTLGFEHAHQYGIKKIERDEATRSLCIACKKEFENLVHVFLLKNRKGVKPA